MGTVILIPSAVILIPPCGRRIFVIALRVNSAKSGLWTPMCPPDPRNRGISPCTCGMRENLCHFGENSRISTFLFNNILASPRLSRNPFIFKHSSGSIVFHFVFPFVFNNSSRSTFIFNIFFGSQSPCFDQQVRELRDMAKARLFHPHPQRRASSHPSMVGTIARGL